MDIRKVKKLIELLEGSNLSELKIQEGDDSIRLSRNSTQQINAPVTAPAIAASQTAASPAPTTEPAEVVPDDDSINSPMVGTYYGASKPDAPDFVKVGDTVKPGDVLCIIEAMKIFNQIEADKSGTITAILKQNSDPVEFGEPLFLIK